MNKYTVEQEKVIAQELFRLAKGRGYWEETVEVWDDLNEAEKGSYEDEAHIVASVLGFDFEYGVRTLVEGVSIDRWYPTEEAARITYEELFDESAELSPELIRRLGARALVIS